MFSGETYVRRREGLAERLGQGLVILPGHGESPINAPENCYRFRQDSTFLYYVGVDRPDLVAVLDVDEGTTTLFGDDLILADIVWTGEHPTVAEWAEASGIQHKRPLSALRNVLDTARNAGREVDYLPPYRAETVLLLAGELRRNPEEVGRGASTRLVRAVVDQRSRKEPEEIAEIEKAVEVSVAMHEAAMRMARPGVSEESIAAEASRIAEASGGRTAYPVIATVEGQILHNHAHVGTLGDGDLFLLDAGAETARGYAGDLTSTFPVSEDFSERQRDVYEIVLTAYRKSIAAIAPGVSNRDVHLVAARAIFEGMKELGIMRGDPEEALAEGAHALVFPHGIGHMLGLDVHDMESLGEDQVGYGDAERSDQFGLRSLRLARSLEPGFVITIEPGIYFIPRLIEEWKSQGRCGRFIDFGEIDRWRGFGGVRNEENFLVRNGGAHRLGPRKPQTPEEMRAVRDSGP
jgi:Xaa-Pro aminopeptidase